MIGGDFSEVTRRRALWGLGYNCLNIQTHIFAGYKKHARIMEYGFSKYKRNLIMVGAISISLLANEPKKSRKIRGTCNAKTRKNALCQAPPVWDKSKDKPKNGRCKLHGGLSTGARTEKGREAIRESNRRRAKERQASSG